MRFILLFLATAASLFAQSSLPPIGSTIPLSVTATTNHPGAVAQWRRPDTNLWTPEFSTNGVEWTDANFVAGWVSIPTMYCEWTQWSAMDYRSNRIAKVPYLGWNYVETPSSAQVNLWQVRLKRIR